MKQSYLIKTANDLADLNNVIIGLDITKPQLVVIGEAKNVRSLAQNSLLWKWYTEMANHIFYQTGRRYNTKAIHIEMKGSFLKPKVYELKNKTVQEYSTKNLNTKEFTVYLEKLDFYCTDSLNLQLTHPISEYDLAMGR